MTPTQLLDDYKKNQRYGSIEFVYKGGNIVFVKKIETLITSAPYEKNSLVATKENHGSNNGHVSENY